ncbi:MAG: DinB family protein, partial [Chloroflexota bacterium]
TKDFTHEDSMKQLPFPGNCMNWNLGHIIVYRAQYLGLLDGVSKPDEGEFSMYGAGSEPLTDSAKAIPLETLLERIESSGKQVISALENVTQAKLDEVIDEERGTTLDERLSFYLVFHESYHTGQLEILHELALAER